MLRTLSWAADGSLSVFLFGGTSNLLKTLADRMSARFPTLTIAGMGPSAFRKLASEPASPIRYG